MWNAESREPALGRMRWGSLENPIRGLLHGSMGLVSFGLAAYWWALSSCEESLRLSLTVFAGSQFALYTASACYHSVPWTPRWKERMQRLDHSMIYVKIAGSMTPLVWVGLEPPERWWILGAAWAVGGLGVAQKLLLPRVHPKACIPVQIAQATLVIPALVGFADRFPGLPVLLLGFIAGIYCIGVVIFVTERPRLWPRVFGFHEAFHVITVVASATYFFLALTTIEALGKTG
ncbi:MAG: hemolysin III family protein [Myxococcota bacterium]|nr:hemolysin III family protein [Myxococcota bacterium]